MESLNSRPSLSNLRSGVYFGSRKNRSEKPIRISTPIMMAMDSTRLQLPDEAYDRVLVFFLLHEQPAGVRRQTLREVFRVVKPGGKVVIVDYARPRWWNPLRWLWRPVLAALEPFALDLWRDDIGAWTPASRGNETATRRFFGGLYQMVTVTRAEQDAA